jgi:hypothetical protein
VFLCTASWPNAFCAAGFILDPEGRREAFSHRGRRNGSQAVGQVARTFPQSPSGRSQNLKIIIPCEAPVAPLCLVCFCRKGEIVLRARKKLSKITDWLINQNEPKLSEGQEHSSSLFKPEKGLTGGGCRVWGDARAHAQTGGNGPWEGGWVGCLLT